MELQAETKHASGHAHGHQSFWLWIMCLTGVDYFSTLGYQPSIAFEATGLLTPFATVILVLVTLLGALPVYSYVAGKSPHGQGSIAMLERLVFGWPGKILVLVLLGFAATDFVITKTLSAADAAVHLLENPLWPDALKTPNPERLSEGAAKAFKAASTAAEPAHEEEQHATTPAQMFLTMALLVALGAMFLRGFKEVIGTAVAIVATYLLLNAIVVLSGLTYLAEHPTVLNQWYESVQNGAWQIRHHPLEGVAGWSGTGWGAILLVCIVLFPKLALGLSGFETGVAVMPLIKGKSDDTLDHPQGRIRNTRKLLLTAAVIMSFYLLASSMVVSTLIGPEQLRRGGAANGRALAYLAHGDRLTTGEMASAMNPLFGELFGTIYDLSTVVILWFAGASAMAGLLNLVPQYLPRYGMAPEWTRAFRPLVLLFTAVNLFVTWRFEADVDAQGAAYATGVLVLMTSACVATVIDRWRSSTRRFPLFRVSWPFLAITIVFIYTTIANVWEKPDGIRIASWFILAIVVASAVSRFARSKELRFQGFVFVDERSKFLWDSMKMLEFPVLVPHRPGGRSLAEKEEIIREEHRLGPDVPIVFIEATVRDASDFYQTPQLEVIEESGRFILRISRCASIAHTIAALALELSKTGQPPEIHFGWSNESPMAANIGFLLFGEGNVPWMVRELILQAEPNPDRQPRVVIG